MILVDTSAWVAFFRNRGPIAEVVDRAIESNEVAICGPILTELRRGFRSRPDRDRCLPLLDACQMLPQPTSLWDQAGDLGFLLARKGVTVKTLDLLIAVFALANDIPVLTLDDDFRLMAHAGAGLHLVDS